MKAWNYRTYKGRRFYRLNHAELSRDKFFLAYYRILHTVYLSEGKSCSQAVKEMFEETFGLEPKPWSMDYIFNTEPCWVNDTVVEQLRGSGRFCCPECLKQMLIEIGFDVYLIQTIEANQQPERKSFYRWLPLKKEHSLKKSVKNFWKERLPKEKLLPGLYYSLETYKNEILTTYRKLLVENDILPMSVPEKEMILAYIETNQAVLSLAEDIAEAETVTEVEQQEEVVQQEEVKPVLPITKAATDTVQKRKKMPVSNGRGFRESSSKMSQKKAVTCAVCVAAAGALLIPLVAYTVIKHKTV